MYANAPATALSSSITALDTIITLDSVTGLPINYPYILILDRGEASEEVVLVTSASGDDLTVTRGYDSTVAFSHPSGAEVVHGISAIDPREANAHVNAASNVHGIAGSVVGTTDTQTLTNKNLSSGTNTFPATLATDDDITAVTSAINAVDAALDSHEADNITHGVTGSIVGTSDTQTLTNKNLSSGTNTFPSSLATDSELNTAAFGGSSRTAAPFARIVRTSSQTIPEAGATINFNALGEETDSSFGDTANGQLVAPIAGLYLIDVYVPWEPESGGWRRIKLRVAGTLKRYHRIFPSSNVEVYQHLSVVVRVGAGDAITVDAEHSLTGGWDVLGSANDYDRVSLSALWLAP
jgi:hypothetical protein